MLWCSENCWFTLRSACHSVPSTSVRYDERIIFLVYHVFSSDPLFAKSKTNSYELGVVVTAFIIYYCTRLLKSHISTIDGRIVGADGILWWSPSQVLATSYCVCLVMASRRPIYTFQWTGYTTESNEKKYFAVLCEWLTPLTTFMNWKVFWINICCFFYENH